MINGSEFGSLTKCSLEIVFSLKHCVRFFVYKTIAACKKWHFLNACMHATCMQQQSLEALQLASDPCIYVRAGRETISLLLPTLQRSTKQLQIILDTHTNKTRRERVGDALDWYEHCSTHQKKSVAIPTQYTGMSRVVRQPLLTLTNSSYVSLWMCHNKSGLL